MSEVLDHVFIDYRQDLKILFCRFTQPAVTSEKLRQAYLYALDKGRAHQVSCWLIDVRRRGPALPEDEAWLLQDYAQMVESSIPQKLAFAYLLTPTLFTHFRENIGVDKLLHLRPRVTVNIFDSEQAAIDWLSLNHRLG